MLLLRLQLFFIEFVEAVVRLAYYKRKQTLEEGPDESGKGLSPHTVVEELDIIVTAMTEYCRRRTEKGTF